MLRHHLLAALQHLGREHLADRVVRDGDVLADGENLVQQLLIHTERHADTENGKRAREREDRGRDVEAAAHVLILARKPPNAAAWDAVALGHGRDRDRFVVQCAGRRRRILQVPAPWWAGVKQWHSDAFNTELSCARVAAAFPSGKAQMGSMRLQLLLRS